MTTETLERRTHYLAENGPREWMSDVEVARWLMALCLKRDGRADCIARADAIIPRDPQGEPSVGLDEREGVALAVAMYVAGSGSLEWSVARIADAFGVDRERAAEAMDVMASAVLAAPPLRDGVHDVSLQAHAAVMVRDAA